MNGDRKPYPVVQTNFDERDAQFSPDGKWIAYQSNESGRFEIYIQPFPGPGSKLQVSTNGGAQVRWGPHGKELFYIALDARLMAVPIRLASNPQTAEPGSPTPLFATRVDGALQGNFMQQYDVSSDGLRFLMNTITEEAASPITVILNWNPGEEESGRGMKNGCVARGTFKLTLSKSTEGAEAMLAAAYPQARGSQVRQYRR